MIDRAQSIDKPMVERESREDRIRHGAHARYRMRTESGGPGDESTDWLGAEAEIDAQAAGSPDVESESAPGDEAPVGTTGTGEGVCPVCGGTGKVATGPCAECDGRGWVNVGLG